MGGGHGSFNSPVKGRECIADHSSQRGKRFVFEDPKPSSSNLGATALSAQECLDTWIVHEKWPRIIIPATKDSVIYHQSHSNTLNRGSDIAEGALHGQATLMKRQAMDSESVEGEKRFSRHHSKNGLAAVF